MKCERCKINESTVHLTEIIKGVKSEVHLCESCARDIGLNSKLSNFSLAVPDFLSFLSDEIKEINGEVTDETVCKRCGTDYASVKKSHKMGCPFCYHYFSERLKDIQSSNDTNGHRGRVPEHFSEIESVFKEKRKDIELVNDVNKLQTQLSQAVDNEEYEQAALIRDKIKDLEQTCRE